MSDNKEGQELQGIQTEGSRKQASDQESNQAGHVSSATSKEPKNDSGDPENKNPSSNREGRGWKIFSGFWNKLKLGDKMGKLKGLKVISLIQNNSVTSRNLVVAAATGGLEHLLNAEAFNCPDSGYQLYGYTFLFGPIFILFCVNVLVIGEIWKLTSRRYVNRYHRRGDFIARLIPSLLKACVGPAVWLIVAFLEEDYYLCAKLGPFPSNGNGTSELEMTEMKQKIEEQKSRSHVWAWIVLVGLVACGTIVVVCKHCFVKDNILMNNNFEYERREALGAMKRFTELMNPGANSNDTDLTTVTTTKTTPAPPPPATKDPATPPITTDDPIPPPPPPTATDDPTPPPPTTDDPTPPPPTTDDPTPPPPPPTATDDPVERLLKAEYSGKEEKIKYYKDGVPEKIGRETVDKLFEGHKDWTYGNEWHYIKAFEAFKGIYPRIATGSPLDPWRAVERDEKRTKKKTANQGGDNNGKQQKTPKQKKPQNPWVWKKLQPLNFLNEKGTNPTTSNPDGNQGLLEAEEPNPFDSSGAQH